MEIYYIKENFWINFPIVNHYFIPKTKLIGKGQEGLLSVWSHTKPTKEKENIEDF